MTWNGVMPLIIEVLQSEKNPRHFGEESGWGDFEKSQKHLENVGFLWKDDDYCRWFIVKHCRILRKN